MHELTKKTEEWLSNKGWHLMKFCEYKHSWEEKVLLPYIKEQEKRRAKVETAIDFWGIEKRREQAEWCKKEINNGGTLRSYNEVIDEAFQVKRKEVCRKCGQEVNT
jgi:hypothetical protein